MDEWEPIPLSRLSQAAYCLRRAALLTNEQIWVESADTAKGRAEHTLVHTERMERRGSEIKLFEHTVFSRQLGISGKCDCIEAEKDEAGCMIPDVEFPVRLFPVEYKHGNVRDEEEYNIQLCAQAMCLEEMYNTQIQKGAIFYTSAHRRKIILLDQLLRTKVEDTIYALDSIRKNFLIPQAECGPKCKRCSIREVCLPDAPVSAAKYCQRLAKEAMEDGIL